MASRFPGLEALADTVSGHETRIAALEAKLALINSPAPPVVKQPTTQAPSDPVVIVGPSSSVVLTEDFRKYADDLALQLAYKEQSSGGKVELLHLDKVQTLNGHPTMRYDQPGGSSATPQPRAKLPRAMSDLWYRGVYRFSPGWTTVGTGTDYTGKVSAAAYKWLAFTWAGGYDSRIDISFTNTKQIQVTPGLMSRTAGMLFYSASSSAPNTITSSADVMWDGAWWELTAHLVASGPTFAIDLWVGPAGESPRWHTQVVTRTSDGSAVPPLAGVKLGSNFNQTRRADQTQALWLGEWQVIDGRAHPDPFDVQ